MWYYFNVSTLRQRVAYDNLVENGGNVSKAMIDAHYSKQTAKTPQKLTNSKGWIELLEEKIPDHKLLRKHNQLLDKKEFMAVGERGDRHIEPTGEIDPQAVARALDMAYKLKSKYPATAVDVSGAIAVVKVVNYADAPVEAEIVTDVAEE